MGSEQRHPEVVAAQDHESAVVAVAERCFEVLGVSRKAECVALDAVFVDGSGHKYVDESLTQVGYRAFESHECGLSGNGGRLSGLHFGVLGHDVDYVVLSVAGVERRCDLAQCALRHVERSPVIRCDLGRSVNYRGAYFGYSRIIYNFEYQFVSYAIDVAVGDSHFYLVIFVHQS